MDEKKIEEYINRFNKNFEEFEKKHKSEMDKYVAEFNKNFEEFEKKHKSEMDKYVTEFNKKFENYMAKIDKRLEESEERQNSRLAYIEQTYGDKINAIFDKIMVMDEYIQENNKEIKKAIQKLEKHDDILYSHNFRITNLENKIESV